MAEICVNDKQLINILDTNDAIRQKSIVCIKLKILRLIVKGGW